jgi:hypothetical protein
LSKKRIGSVLIFGILITIAAAVLLNLQYIQDSIQYYRYTPDSEVAQLAIDAGMGDRGKFLFYASHPSLSDATSFNHQCGTPDASTAILGCYNGSNIYIYNITDARLEGIRPTTAAHEMLHAAYNRLDEKEKQRINSLLETEYDRLKDDTELAGRMSFYERTQPGERDNELHSIIGTEISQISAELEAYYGRYFSDRSKVVAEHDSYRLVFDQLKTQADELNARIDRMKGEIDQLKATYEAKVPVVEASIAAFNSKAGSGGFEDQASFTRERQALVAKTAELDSIRDDINTKVNEYNALVAELNTIVIETNTLNQSIDSKVEPVPSL